ncbi:hypothetical protein BS78_K124000 [Paspalum vaginatum]|uniref:Uncharacterized protein n=1 Tax=Paspalum vaginatum TaxID=158149 RepID=A0A9W7XEV6_9POAL|nr:hypothetical protein BS78_K124000 [Paspalum vaginatum]
MQHQHQPPSPRCAACTVPQRTKTVFDLLNYEQKNLLVCCIYINLTLPCSVSRKLDLL